MMCWLTTKFSARCTLLLVASYVIATWSSRASCAEPEDWPRWRGVRGDGSWYGPALPDAWPESGLKLVWKQPIGGGYSGISVVANRVYTMDRQTDPTERERLLCFSAVDGSLNWSVDIPVNYGDLQYGSGPRSAPTVEHGRVYALGATGRLICVDAASGRRHWSRDLVQDDQGRMPTWGYAASPVILDGRLIVMTGSASRSVLALDPRTGKRLWFSLQDEAGYAPPVLLGDGPARQMICWTPSHIRSLHPDTGALNWSVPYPVTMGVAIATPVAHRGVLLVSGYWEGSRAIRLGKTSREFELIWSENRFLRALMSQPLCRDGYAYLLDKRFGLTCLEMETGRKLWDDGNRMTPRGRNPHASIVQLKDSNRVLILNSDGDLILARLSPQKYTELSRTRIIDATWSHPAFAQRFVFARSDTHIVCRDLLSGASDR